MKKLTTFLAMLAMLVSGARADEGRWRSEPAMLHSRAAHAVVSDTNFIYALAGTGPAGPVLEVERFDGRTWKDISTLPGNGLNAPAAALLKGRIYLIGGFNTTSNVPSDEVLVFDIAKHAWSKAAPLPAPRGGQAVAVLDGKIYVTGGGNSQATIADHSVYDPAKNQWRNLAPLPRAEGSPALVAWRHKLYAIGGRSGYSDFGDVYIYDPASDQWSAGPSIEPRGTAGAVVYCKAIHVFGGESQTAKSSLDDVFRLNDAGDAWQKLTPMAHPRSFARAVNYKGAVFVVGGSPTAGPSHSSAGSPVVESFRESC